MNRTTSLCYVRRPGGSWELASSVYERILSLYEELQGDRRSRQAGNVTICTTGADGCVLMAQVGEKPHAQGVYLCQVGDGDHTVEVMRCAIALEQAKKNEGKR
jgi:hypothetical protein